MTGSNQTMPNSSRPSAVPLLTLPASAPSLGDVKAAPDPGAISAQVHEAPRTGRGGKDFEERFQKRKVAAQATHRFVIFAILFALSISEIISKSYTVKTSLLSRKLIPDFFE